MLDAVEIVKHFSRQTGIVDKNVDLLLNGLYKFPARQFLFTPFGCNPVYYTTHVAEEKTELDEMFMKKYMGLWPKGKPKEPYVFGRGIAINNDPRK